MRRTFTEYLFARIKSPLLRAISLIRAHSAEISSTWRKRLHSAGLTEVQVELLQSMTWNELDNLLETGNVDAYRYELECLALQCESQGLTEADVSCALAMYLECCLPYLFEARVKGKEAALALAHILAVEQSVVLSSFASSRAAGFRRVQERERHNLSRDLHDDIGHNLLVLKLYLEMMSIDLSKGDVSNLESKLPEALALASYAVDSVRRLMLNLGPAMLSQFGFVRALRIYSRQFALRTGIDVKVEVGDLPETLPAGQETALYRVLQGALSNILQHSQARNVKINIGATSRSVVLSIQDDGGGFDISGTMPHKAFGILAMRERVEGLGGKFHIASWLSRPGTRRHGTRIEIDLPLD